MTHDPLHDWSEEARAFLGQLKSTSLPEGFAEEFRATQSEMAWFASMSIHGRLGQFKLQLWTTPALAWLGQARLTLLPDSGDAIVAFGETTMPVLQCEKIEDFSPLIAYLRMIVEYVDTKDGLLKGLRVGGDPRRRTECAELVVHVRNMHAPLKPKDGSS